MSVSPQIHKKGAALTSRKETDFESLLMEAEHDRVNYIDGNKSKKYEAVIAVCSNSTDGSLLYDGTPLKLVAETGYMAARAIELVMIMNDQTAVTNKLETMNQLLHKLPVLTHRNAGVRISILFTVSDYLSRYDDPKWKQWYMDECDMLSASLPPHGGNIRIIRDLRIRKYISNNNLLAALELMQEIEEYHPDLKPMQIKAISGFYAATGYPEKAFSTWLNGLARHGSPADYVMLCNATITWASEKDRKKYPEVLKAIYFKKAIQNWPRYLDRLQHARDWMDNTGVTLTMLDSAIQHNSTNLMDTVLKTLKQPGSLLAAAKVFLNNGETNRAAQCAFEALKRKTDIVSDIRPLSYLRFCPLPTQETEMLAVCKDSLSAELRQQYVQWLEKLQKEHCRPNIKQAYEKEYLNWKN